MVSNLRELPGIVSLEANSEDSQLIVIFNGNIVTVDDIITQLRTTGDEVTNVETQN